MRTLGLFLLFAVIGVSDPTPKKIIVFDFSYAGGDPGAAAGVGQEVRRLLAADGRIACVDPPEGRRSASGKSAMHEAAGLGCDYLVAGSIVQIGASYDIKYDVIEVATGAKAFSARLDEPWDAGYEAIAGRICGPILERDSLFPALEKPPAEPPDTMPGIVQGPDSTAADTAALLIEPADTNPGETLTEAVRPQVVVQPEATIPPDTMKIAAEPKRTITFNIHAGAGLGFYPQQKTRPFLALHGSLMFAAARSILVETTYGITTQFGNYFNISYQFDVMAHRIFNEDPLFSYAGIGLGFHNYREYQLFPQYEEKFLTVDIAAGLMNSNRRTSNITPEMKLSLIFSSSGIAPEISVKARFSTPWFSRPKISIEENPYSCCTGSCLTGLIVLGGILIISSLAW